MTGFPIRQAVTPAEKQAIYQFRYQIYIAELTKTHIPSDHAGKLLFDEADKQSALFYAVDGNRLIGTVRGQAAVDTAFMEKDYRFFEMEYFARLFGHQTLAIVDRLMVEPEFRNGGLGHELMLAIYLYGLKVGSRCCFIVSDDSLLPLYLRYGFRQYGGEAAVLPGGEKRYRLVMFMCDREYFALSKSPLYFFLPKELDDKGEYARMAQEQLKPVVAAPVAHD